MFKVNSQTFILLGGLKCEKLANNVIKVTNMDILFCGVEVPTPIEF